MPTTSTHAEENAALVREYFEAVWDDDTYRDDLVRDDYEIHVETHEERSYEEMKAATRAFHRAFPDLEVTIEDVVAADDRVVLRYLFSGTHEKELKGIPPTGKAVEVVGVGIYRIEDGQLAEVWYVDDYLGFMQQLGVVPDSLGAIARLIVGKLKHRITGE